MLDAKKSFASHSLQVRSSTDDEIIKLTLYISELSSLQFSVHLGSMEYGILYCTAGLQALDVTNKCQKTVWELMFEADYFELSCDGNIYLNYQYTTSGFGSCTRNVSGKQFISFMFTTDTTVTKYRLVPLPHDTDFGKMLRSERYCWHKDLEIFISTS